MDPNAALQMWRDGDKEGFYNLAGWIRSGGFAPRWTPAERAKVYNYINKTRKPGTKALSPNPMKRKAVKRRAVKRKANPCAPKAQPNPRVHIPRTARGRPMVKKDFIIERYDAQNRSLGDLTFKGTKTEAHAKARSLIGRKARGAVINRVVLDDGK